MFNRYLSTMNQGRRSLYTLAMIPGDGIGKEVVPVSVI
jgi:hypothetical protein